MLYDFKLWYSIFVCRYVNFIYDVVSYFLFLFVVYNKMIYICRTVLSVNETNKNEICADL